MYLLFSGELREVRTAHGGRTAFGHLAPGSPEVPAIVVKDSLLTLLCYGWVRAREEWGRWLGRFASFPVILVKVHHYLLRDENIFFAVHIRMIISSLKQTETPLNNLFFSEFNINILQRAIREDFKNKTGLAIDYQANSDLVAIMRVVFINNAGDHFSNVRQQVRAMNERVISTASGQIKTGVAQYLAYRESISGPMVPLDRSVNTSTAGKKIPKSGDFL